MEEKKNLNEELDKKINDIKLEYKNELFNINNNINNFKELNNKNYNEIKEEINLLKTMIISIFNKDIEKNNKNNIKCIFCEKNELLLKKYEKENKELHSVINNLKNQLYKLKLNYKFKKDNKIIKKNKFKVENNAPLPNIQQFFIKNNKYMLIDSNNNLWHLNKCNKFYKYKEKNEGKYNSLDDINNYFKDEYEKNIEYKNNEEEKIWKNLDEIINSINSINEKEKDKVKENEIDKDKDKDKDK